MYGTVLLTFEYDPDKASSNQTIHGVSFDEAFTSILDPSAIWLYDKEHSIDEDRWISIGMSNKQRVLFTSFTMRGNDVYRIISSRKAENKEEELYQRF